MGLEFVEDLIPEILIILVTIVTLVLCIYSALKTRDLPAAGYVPPLIYILGIYIYYWLGNPGFLEREFFSRLAFLMLLIDISIWRVAEIISNKRRNGTGFKPVTIHDVKSIFRDICSYSKETVRKIFKWGR